MVTFSKMELKDGQLITVQTREIAQSSLQQCPHVIFMPDHYRPDGSCRCNDRGHTEMREWGYRWSRRKARWI
jgi:hypothetical protein